MFFTKRGWRGVRSVPSRSDTTYCSSGRSTSSARWSSRDRTSASIAPSSSPSYLARSTLEPWSDTDPEPCDSAGVSSVSG